MYSFERLLRNKDLFREFIERISGDYREELEMISEGMHFTEKSLGESGIQIKYSWTDIEKCMKGMRIVFPEEVTKEDIVYTVSYLIDLYYPLIPDLPSALKFTEKYIMDPAWPDHDKPYRLYYDKYKKSL